MLERVSARHVPSTGGGTQVVVPKPEVRQEPGAGPRIFRKMPSDERKAVHVANRQRLRCEV